MHSLQAAEEFGCGAAGLDQGGTGWGHGDIGMGTWGHGDGMGI